MVPHFQGQEEGTETDIFREEKKTKKVPPGEKQSNEFMECRMAVCLSGLCTQLSALP